MPLIRSGNRAFFFAMLVLSFSLTMGVGMMAADEVPFTDPNEILKDIPSQVLNDLSSPIQATKDRAANKAGDFVVKKMEGRTAEFKSKVKYISHVREIGTAEAYRVSLDIGEAKVGKTKFDVSVSVYLAGDQLPKARRLKSGDRIHVSGKLKGFVTLTPVPGNPRELMPKLLLNIDEALIK